VDLASASWPAVLSKLTIGSGTQASAPWKNVSAAGEKAETHTNYRENALADAGGVHTCARQTAPFAVAGSTESNRRIGHSREPGAIKNTADTDSREQPAAFVRAED